MSVKPKTVYIIGTNHFDPIWRRGYKKSFYYNNQKYVGNSVIEDACLSDWLELCKDKSVCFEVESAMVLRDYLEIHPEQKPHVKQLIRENRLELLACGEVIPDTNMPGGETLVRNLVYGLLWARDELDIKSETGNLNDSFGCSAQLPQIFKKCGIDIITGLSYKFPDGKYWQGLDGTIIRILPNLQYPWLGIAKYLSSGTYYRPCSFCAGDGCNECANRGFEHSFRMGAVPDLEGLDLENNEFGVIYVGGEETLTSLKLPEFIAQAQEKYKDIEFKFGLHKHLTEKYWQSDLLFSQDQDKRDIAPQIEGNPIQTGCYVSRIKTKQEVRRLENRAIAIETLLSLTFINGYIYPANIMLEVWRKIAFCSFHDSITGTHVDVGYEELLETYSRCDQLLAQLEAHVMNSVCVQRKDSVTIFNPHSVKVSDYIEINCGNENNKVIWVEDLPACGYKILKYNDSDIERYPTVKGISITLESDYYRISIDNHGITGIYDKEFEKELISPYLGYANELILENDFGDPWTTREEDRTRTNLGKMNEIKSVTHNINATTVTYKGKFRGNEKLLDDPADYRVLLLEWEQTVVLYKNVKRIDFQTKILWDTFDRRIRVAFPTYMSEDDGYYSVPYGVVKRPKYDKEARKGVGVADGDWPAVEWFSTAKVNDINVALINNGTPSSRIEKGNMMISLLRSPTFPSCLHWPNVYYAPVYDGMRDRGHHTFDYALTSFSGHWHESDVFQMAQEFNRKPVVFMNAAIKAETINIPVIESDSTILSACKVAEDQTGIVLRLFEYKGKKDIACISMPDLFIEYYETNMLEEKISDLCEEGSNKLILPMGPFEVKTIKLKLK